MQKKKPSIQQKMWAMKSMCKTEVSSSESVQKTQRAVTPGNKRRKKNKKQYLQKSRRPARVRVQFRVPDTGRQHVQQEVPTKQSPRSSSVVSPFTSNQSGAATEEELLFPPRVRDEGKQVSEEKKRKKKVRAPLTLLPRLYIPATGQLYVLRVLRSPD